MPIRIRPNKPSGSRDNSPNDDGGGNRNIGGGGGLIGAFLPLIINFLMRNPRKSIPLIIIGVLVYFFFFRNSGCGGINGDNVSNLFSTGGNFDEQKYKSTEIFEPLADNIKNPLPEKVSLLKYAPQRLNQGQQGSCVGWSSSYAARTILYARETGEDPNSSRFSPSFLYNQIALEGCQGTYLTEAMKSLSNVGDLPLSEFRYDERTCDIQPNNSQKQNASKYRIKGYNRLTKGGENSQDVDLLAIKQNLANGAPVVIGMMVGGSFMQNMMGQKVWIPNQRDYGMSGFGGHAMCVIGYDDYLEGGAFQIMNSWGEDWGEKGIGWVRYKDFKYFTKEAYGLYPMGNSDKVNSNKLEMKFGLYNTDNKTNINLAKVNNLLYKTSSHLNKNTSFVVEVSNNIECYTYVIGLESDNSTYVLFPYTPKHSPYCGITGTRFFPNDHSLYPDENGNSDFMAIIITKKPIDYKSLNDNISKSNGTTLSDKIKNTLGNKLIITESQIQNSTININTTIDIDQYLAIILQIDKK